MRNQRVVSITLHHDSGTEAGKTFEERFSCKTIKHLPHRIINEVLYETNGPWLYWAWAASVVGPVVYILAVVHAVLWGLPSAIVGSLVCIA